MTAPNVVCIPTAGAATRMGALGEVVNKALLPLGDKAVISHIIDGFPVGTEFVIAVGEKGEQVRAYLELAHPDVDFTFVEVDNFNGPGAGPGYSILCCRTHLARPFWFVPCDCLYEIDFGQIPDGDWVGVSPVARENAAHYCNFVVDGDQVVQIHDKFVPEEGDLHAFTGLLCVRDHEKFWSALEVPELVAGEHQISNGLAGLVAGDNLSATIVPWTDVGDREKYEAVRDSFVEYDFSKQDEILYRFPERVVKFFADEKIVAARVKKAGHKPDVFPDIEGVRRQFYGYQFVPGQTLYERNDHQLFTGLLDWLDADVWTPVDVETERMRTLCRVFYFDKTQSRLADFASKYPDYREPLTVNGKPLPPREELLANVPWDELCEGVPVFMHGDLQFDNIIHDARAGRFCLLDWRQDFAGETEFGDLYYDLAKLWGGINLNYDYIKANMFRVDQSGDDLVIDFAQRYSTPQLSRILDDWILGKGLSKTRVELLVGLIYLNMAPMHHAPFDIALMGLGRSLLTDALERASS